MKKLVAVLVLTFSSQAFAKGQQIVTDITFKKGSTLHKYTLVNEGKKGFKLVFKANRKKPIVKSVSNRQADLIRSEATRIIWNSEYRKPASMPRCSDYVQIKADAEKTNVCVENFRASGMAYGLLNALGREFGMK